MYRIQPSIIFLLILSSLPLLEGRLGSRTILGGVEKDVISTTAAAAAAASNHHKNRDGLRGPFDLARGDGGGESVRKLELELQPELVSFGGTPPDSVFPLGLCEGDCDEDDDCEGGLTCFQRGSNEPVPGCYYGLDDNSKTDYCIVPNATYTEGNYTAEEVDAVTTTTSLPTISPTSPPTTSPTSSPTKAPNEKPTWPIYTFNITMIGNDAELTEPLGICEGDCDSDSDCAPELICYQREPNQPIPGCEGEDRSRNDYCVVPPEEGPTSEPTEPPTAAPTTTIEPTTSEPTAPPTVVPTTTEPTSESTALPTVVSESTTTEPTLAPTESPTDVPTAVTTTVESTSSPTIDSAGEIATSVPTEGTYSESLTASPTTIPTVQEIDSTSIPTTYGPDNDFCPRATRLQFGDMTGGSTNLAAQVDGSPECGDALGIGVWYRFRSQGDPLGIQVQANFPARMTILRGPHCNNLTCIEQISGFVQADDTSLSYLWNAQDGERHYIVIDGVDGATGDFDITVDEFPDPTSEPTASPAPSSTIPANYSETIGEQVTLPDLENVGNNGEFSTFPLDACMGDCDKNDDCLPGLICYQRRGNEAVPGCGPPSAGDSGLDFCMDPNAIANQSSPTMAPTEEPTVATSEPTNVLNGGSVSLTDMTSEPTAVPVTTSEPTGAPVTTSEPTAEPAATSEPTAAQTQLIGDSATQEPSTNVIFIGGSATLTETTAVPTLEVECTRDVHECPDGSVVVRDNENDCEFFPCPDVGFLCPDDVFTCPDGITIGRSGPGCKFEPCPNTGDCALDIQACPDGSYVGRDSSNDCEFRSCPESESGESTLAPTMARTEEGTVIMTTVEEATMSPTTGPTVLSTAATTSEELTVSPTISTTLSPTTQPTTTPTMAPSLADTSTPEPTTSPTMETTTSSPTPIVLEALQLVSNNDASAQLLEECQGDCDADPDCGPGLKCFQRYNRESVPGCTGGGVYGADYCIKDANFETAQGKRQ